MSKTTKSLREQFEREYQLWRAETRFLSTGNLNNVHFENIVAMGISAVPYIFEKLEQEESFLVAAYDRIFPGVLTYENGNYVPLSEVIKVWQGLLREHFSNSKKEDKNDTV